MCLIAHTLKVKKLIIVMMVGTLLISSLTGYGQTSSIVGSVNQQKTESKEVVREMNRLQAEVMNTFIKNHQLKDLQNFWTKDFDGKNPLQELRKTAIDKLITIKVQEELFKEHNLWPYVNYEALLKDMQEVNVTRDKMVQENKVIYGPVIFSERTFFDYQFSNAIIKVKANLKKSVFDVSDKALLLHLEKMKKGIFANNKESFDDLRSRIETSYIDQEYDKLIQQKRNTAIVKINYDVINQIEF